MNASQTNKQFVASVKSLVVDPTPYCGMEGPFQFKCGWVGYYDPREGKYYDRGRDLYLTAAQAWDLVS